MARLCPLFLLSLPLAGQPHPEYTIHRATSKITIDAKLDDPAWRQAPAVGDFVFNWFTTGEKEPTEAKLLWDDDNLYVSWRCRDKHISAYEKQRHGPVSRDDCVEIFLSPNPAKVRNYYTFEINAIGTMLNRCRTDWWQGGPTWEPEGVVHRTTYHGLAKKDESSDDAEWVVEMAVPLVNFARDAANIPPREGDQWRLNLMRTGGKTNAQQSTWSPIAPPARGFHTPEAFGIVRFAAAQASRGMRVRQRFDPAEAAAGREIYNRSCTMCHGLDGAAGDRAPALGAQRRYLRSANDEMFDAIKNGIQGTLMPASPLPDGDINRIIAYVRSLRATAAESVVAGDVRNGESLFHGKGRCADCHMISGRGGLVGGDLSNIGAERSLTALKSALTEPRPIPRGFQPVLLVTKDGRKVRGVVKNEHNTSLQILSLDNRLELLLRDEIGSITYEEKSLMPADYGKTLSATEMQDLLAFLSRQALRGQSQRRGR